VDSPAAAGLRRANRKTTHCIGKREFAHPGTGNNGQIQSITDSTGTPEAGRSVSYTYDAWARLKTAATSGSAQYPAWGLQWSYDRYGNRKQQTVTAGSAPSSSVTIDPLSNRLSGAPYAYDASGNMTHDGLNLMTLRRGEPRGDQHRQRRHHHKRVRRRGPARQETGGRCGPFSFLAVRLLGSGSHRWHRHPRCIFEARTLKVPCATKLCRVNS
jgi:hypothetical protein